MVQQAMIVKVQTPLGARDAVEFVRFANQYKEDTTILYANKTGSAKSLMFVLSLGLVPGSEIELNGPQECLDRLVRFICPQDQ